jgi:NADP-reducing hydrogenase subunit HndB
MSKISIEDLVKIKNKVNRDKSLDEGLNKTRITVHMGTCGITAGANKISNILMKEIERSGLKDVILTSSGCAGLCSKEPMITIERRGEAPVKYIELTEEKVLKIFNEHILGGKPVSDFAFSRGCECTG